MEEIAINGFNARLTEPRKKLHPHLDTSRNFSKLLFSSVKSQRTIENVSTR